MMELADDMESDRQVNPSVYKPKTLKNELARRGHRQRLPAAKCVAIAIGLARGLQILHEGGFTHRDVRPSNIIFVNGIPKLADIDLLAGHDASLASYIPKHYAAPEGSHSSQADIFSFGKTLYEMCTGLPVKAYPCLPPDIRHWEDHGLLLKINKVIAMLAHAICASVTPPRSTWRMTWNAFNKGQRCRLTRRLDETANSASSPYYRSAHSLDGCRSLQSALHHPDAPAIQRSF